MLRKQQLLLFATQDPVKFRRLRQAVANAGNGNQHRGRQKYSYDFESTIRLIAADSRQCIAWPLVGDSHSNNTSSSSAITAFDPSTTVVADVVTKDELDTVGNIQRPHPMPLYYLSSSSSSLSGQEGEKVEEGFSSNSPFILSNISKRRLQRDADTNLVEVDLSSENNNNNTNKAYLIQVIEPDVREICFQKLEAQVELITAFRNILMEFFEISCPSRNNDKTHYMIHETPRFHTLRVPPLSLAYHGGKFDNGVIEKMHHASLIQALHRCSLDVKDWFMVHKDILRVELCVPRSMIESFTDAFYNTGEAFEIPASSFIPERINLYPGIQMPKTLLETAPGFIGKREEIEALALPYEERVVKLQEIEEREFQQRLEDYQENQRLEESNTSNTTTVSLNESSENSNLTQKVVTEAGEGVRVTMVGSKEAGRNMGQQNMF